jgi:hypothetical protein
MGDDLTPGGAGGVARRPTWPPDNVRWLVEKCALPVTLLLVPIVFQWMGNHQAKLDNKAAAEVAELERKAADERARLERRNADERARQEQRVQLYTSLLNKREETDTAVRRDIFQSLIGTYLQARTANPREKLVQLELLALNFHDTLNLSPLFWELQRQLEQAGSLADHKDLLDQLDRVAKEVKNREAGVLELDGVRRASDVSLSCIEEFDAVRVGWRIPPECRTANAETAQARTEQRSFHLDRVGDSLAPGASPHRDFKLSIVQKDTKNRRLLAVLSWPDEDTRQHRTIQFWVDIFDFPLVNFSRISPNERVALVLNSFDVEEQVAELVLLYFPSNRSAAKDKPYIEDLTRRLLTDPSGNGPASAAGVVGKPAPGK